MSRFFYCINSFLLFLSGISLVLFLDADLIPSTGVVIFFLLISNPYLAIKSSNEMKIKKNLVLSTLGSITIISIASINELISIFIVDEVVSIVRLMPLIFCTLGLYVTYWFISSELEHEKSVKINELITYVLSGPSIIVTLLMSIPITVFMLLIFVNVESTLFEWIEIKFINRGLIPPLTLLIFNWSIILLLNKYIILIVERNYFYKCKEKSYISIAFNKIYDEEIQDVEKHENKVDYISDLIWTYSNDFYEIPRYISWAIPILGFIGTVLGISMAAEGIQRIISNQEGITEITQNLGEAISPLGIAFDTTLIALSLSVILVLIQTSLQRFEHGFLVDVESRLRRIG